ncbi:MAG TPA: Lrp/AsnC family transcriptional regulator [Gammaproteobacteria bacterium]|nr:Lrp/AsnC family transcriptional regulator [Gammaproteobacteria bacterium]
MTAINYVIDRIDSVILSELRRDGRLSFHDLGERVGLSANATAERVRRLISTGVIQGIHAQVDPAAFGASLFAYVDIKTGANTGPDQLGKLLAEISEVRRAVWTTGNFDFTLEVACKDQDNLVRLIEELRKHASIQETYTRLICRELIKNR